MIRFLASTALLTALGFGAIQTDFAQMPYTADPSDDFSFYFVYGGSQFITQTLPPGYRWRLMSEKAVTRVIANRIQDFPKSQSKRLARHLIKLCKKHRFDPAFILSMIHVESRFRVKAISPVGAVGLMQLMPGTAQFIAPQAKVKYRGARTLRDPFANLTLGVTYIAFLREKYRGHSPYFHVAAYNIGPARLDELMGKKGFRPRETLKYFDTIRRGVPDFRYALFASTDRM